MRQLVKVTPLQEEEQILKEIENDNEAPDAIPDEFDVFLLECTQEEELSGLEKNVCLLNDLDDDAFDDDTDDAEDYIEPEETSVQRETNKDIQSIEVPIEQLCKEDNSTRLGQSNKDSPDKNLKLEITATDPSLKVEVEVDLPKELDSPNEKTLKCSVCIKGFIDEDSFNKHVATHSNVTKRRSKTKPIKAKPKKSHTCEICYSRFSRKYNFVRHMTTHLNKQPYTCYLCHKVYQLRHKLVSHLRRHTKEKIFTCDQCQTNFRYKKNLIVHLQLHIREKCYKCDICSAQFANKWYIQTHLRTHTGEKRFSCDFCDNKFKTKRDLETHERIHTCEKPFSCEQCPLTFAAKSNQLSHMKAHTRVKLTCNICKKECQNISEYKRCFSIHMKTLAGQKLFTCLVCHNKFAKKSNLNTHMRTHTGETFACTVCDHRFAQKNDLVFHMRSHTGAKPYGCKLCDRKFAHKRNLRDHTKRHEKAAH